MKRVASLDSRKSGFTLLELLIVLAILIVIIGILGTTVWNSYKRALVRAATVQVTNTLATAVEEFKMEFRNYPTMAEGLYILAGLDNPDAPAAMQQMQMQQQNMGAVGQNGANMNGGMNMTGMNGMDAGMNGGMNMTGMNGMDAGMTGGMNMNGMNGMDATGGMNGGMNMTGVNGAMNMNGTQQGAVAMRPKRKITEPFVQEKDLIDPWNNPIKYEWPTTKGDGKKPAIWSMGPDGEDNQGEGDDIISWDPEDMSGQMRAANQAQAAGFQQNGQLQNGGMNGMNGMNGMTGMTGGMDRTGGMNGMNGMTGGMDMTGGMNGMNGMTGGMDMTGGMNGMNGMTGGMNGMNGMTGGMDMTGGMNGMNGMTGGMNGMTPGAATGAQGQQQPAF